MLKRMRQFYLYKDMSDEQWSINGRACGRLWVYLPDEVSSIIVTYGGEAVPHPRYQHKPAKPSEGTKMWDLEDIDLYAYDLAGHYGLDWSLVFKISREELAETEA